MLKRGRQNAGGCVKKLRGVVGEGLRRQNAGGGGIWGGGLITNK